MTDDERKLFDVFLLKRFSKYEKEDNKNELAMLRKGVGRKPGEMPQLWGIIFEDFPESLFSKYGEPSKAEWAAYISFTLFAMHQQGNSPETNFMHSSGETLGKALRRLVGKLGGNDAEERVHRRFSVMATSSDVEELSNHMRGIIQLLRANNIPLDYVRLAGDIYFYQFPNGRSKVRLRWGQDFYRIPNVKEEE